ncbi:hypothetical protein EVC00_030 [Rhizobium phage RHph_N37]|uniref:Uncharacterized protein n=1 Tax=Rhizobium phage RHph_N37 TaxID=2509749 RepID=A0A7S5R8M8_9CAUD|nr:hypothetical protein EVC00_030 [Rhizobium phage RHph_N37]
MSYEHLSDDDKIVTAIEFVARGGPMPKQLETWLRDNSLYELIMNPIPNFEEDHERKQDREGHSG